MEYLQNAEQRNPGYCQERGLSQDFNSGARHYRTFPAAVFLDRRRPTNRPGDQPAKMGRIIYDCEADQADHPYKTDADDYGFEEFSWQNLFSTIAQYGKKPDQSHQTAGRAGGGRVGKQQQTEKASTQRR